MKKIMILGASELQLSAIRCANNLGLETIVLDYDSNAVGKNLATRFYEVSTLDFEQVLSIALKENINGIMTICSDKPMPIIAEVGEKLGLKTISCDTALKATDKGLMRKALFEHNVPIPKFFICYNIEDVKNAISCIEGKCIFKPSNNSASRGICLYDNEENLQKIYEYTKRYSTDDIILVEEFMEGPEVSVEVFVIDSIIHIIQITDKITTGAPYFVEMGHTQPSSLLKDTQNSIKNVTIQGVNALGINDGPAHVEIKVTNDGPKIVEIGARLGGDHITTDLVPLSTGIDMVELTVKSALNMPIHIIQKFNKSSAIRYVMKEINIPDDIKNKIFYKFNNNDNKQVKSSNDRKGYYIIHGEDLDDVSKMIDTIDQNGRMNSNG